ncbi:MAG: fibronectin type III domain-containing protein, partial [bacterium]
EKLLSVTSQGTPTPTFVEQDVIPPDSITDLIVGDKTYNSISLTWTAPGDDKTLGTAVTYDIRYTLVPITDENWDDAVQVKKELIPNKAGTLENFTISDLSPDTTYYFAIKTSDEMLNWSPLSKVVSGITLKAEDTDIPHAIEFILGSEYSMSETKFTDSFILVGLNGHNKLNKRLSLLTNLQLSSTIVPYQSRSVGLVQKSLEYNVGFLFELYRFHIFNKTSLNSERHAVSVGLLLRGGGVNVEDSSASILVRTFYGVRFVSVGKKFNGAYLCIGVGRSENFVDKEKCRLKIEGFLPIYKTRFKNTVFISWLCDSDGLGDKKDELKFTVGTSMDIMKIFNLINFLSPQEEV